MSAAPAFANRRRISAPRWLTTSDGPPALGGSDPRPLVGVPEVATNRQAAGDPADDADNVLEPLGEIHRGRLAFECRVRRQDPPDGRGAGALRFVCAAEELADLEPIRADAVDRRDRPVEDVVEAL